jgi:[ribosomal protein S5]-alanine N-acetyltransferase
LSTLAPEQLQTPRMTGERLRSDNAAELAGLLLDPRVYPTLHPGPLPPTEVDVADVLARDVKHWERHGFGLWLLRDRATGATVGRGGLMRTEVDGESLVEVAWVITPERWGQGLATELAHATLDVAFGALALDEVVALTLVDNLASRRVMEKAGFAFEGEAMHAGLPHVLYRRRREA